MIRRIPTMRRGNVTMQRLNVKRRGDILTGRRVTFALERDIDTMQDDIVTLRDCTRTSSN